MSDLNIDKLRDTAPLMLFKYPTLLTIIILLVVVLSSTVLRIDRHIIVGGVVVSFTPP